MPTDAERELDVRGRQAACRQTPPVDLSVRWGRVRPMGNFTKFNLLVVYSAEDCSHIRALVKERRGSTF